MALNLNEMSVAVLACVRAGCVPYVEGSGGIGKSHVTTDLLRYINKELGLDYEPAVLMASQRAPHELHSIMTASGNKVIQQPVQELQDIIDGKSGGILLDEITNADVDRQSAILRVLCERMIGMYRIPKTAAIILAGNPTEEASSGQTLADVFMNRITKLEVAYDQAVYAAWVESGYAPVDFASMDKLLSKSWQDTKLIWHTYVTAFLKAHPIHGLRKPEQPDGKKGSGSVTSRAPLPGEPWPSPRAWEKASQLLAITETLPERMRQIRLALLTGTVGAAAATTFWQWYQGILLDPHAVLKDARVLAKAKGRADQVFVTLNACVQLAITKTDYVDGAWRAISWACTNDHSDVATGPARALARFCSQNKLAVPYQDIEGMAEMVRAIYTSK